MRTIKLELVRHGPPHNQLLSPLTPYLALCENHPPVTVHVPFEHNQCLYRLQDLHEGARAGGGIDAPPRDFQLGEMGRALGRLLGEIPGLIAEISREPQRENESIQLRLILSSSELALLPFEAAISSEGLPGTGLPLALQSDVPLCITREVRRSRHHTLGHRAWRPTKILFAWASPPGTGEVPYEAHLLALRKAVDPWCANGKVPITVLPQACVQDIEAECADGSYTHVHILAHGVQVRSGFDYQYALALHDARSPAQRRDEVLGERLAAALRTRCDARRRDAGRPFAVTISSCYGGAQGSVAGAGASIAHALHVEGIPIVVSTQFPLGFFASVRMVEILYDHLLWGKDPRLAVSELRRQLYAELPASHEWASVTGYLEFEPDYVSYVPFYRLNAILLTEPLHTQSISTVAEVGIKDLPRLEEARDRLMDLSATHFCAGNEPDEDAHKPFFEVQRAKLMYSLAFVHELIACAMEAQSRLDAMADALRAAQQSLRDSVTHDGSHPRAMVKLLWIGAILGRTAGHGHDEDGWDPADVWATAHGLATRELARGGQEGSANPRQDLLMLHLVRLAFGQDPCRGRTFGAKEGALHHAEVLWADVSRPDSAREMTEVVQRYGRQFERRHPADHALLALARSVVAMLEKGPTG